MPHGAGRDNELERLKKAKEDAINSFKGSKEAIFHSWCFFSPIRHEGALKLRCQLCNKLLGASNPAASMPRHLRSKKCNQKGNEAVVSGSVCATHYTCVYAEPIICSPLCAPLHVSRQPPMQRMKGIADDLGQQDEGCDGACAAPDTQHNVTQLGAGASRHISKRVRHAPPGTETTNTPPDT